MRSPMPLVHKHTMQRLETVRRVSNSGAEYWLAREIQHELGYVTWESFERVIGRATDALTQSGQNPSHHIREATKMIGVGNGAKRAVADMFLSRAACYFIAMNGDPSKVEIAAAQAYFATQTRAQELDAMKEVDKERVEQRDKIKESFLQVSRVASSAGVKNSKQALFHNARYEGLYNTTSSEYKDMKGINRKENTFDRMGLLELSANDFQMNLAAKSIEALEQKGEAAAIKKNREVAERVRNTMIESGTIPEELPLAEPIKDVRKRIGTIKKISG